MEATSAKGAATDTSRDAAMSAAKNAAAKEKVPADTKAKLRECAYTCTLVCSGSNNV